MHPRPAVANRRIAISGTASLMSFKPSLKEAAVLDLVAPTLDQVSRADTRQHVVIDDDRFLCHPHDLSGTEGEKTPCAWVLSNSTRPP